MSDGLFISLFCTLLVLDLCIAVMLMTRPGFMLALVLRLGASPVRDAILATLASRGPFAWLLSGHSWSTVQQNASAHPEMFPRVVLAYRILGAMVLAVIVFMVGLTAVMVIIR